MTAKNSHRGARLAMVVAIIVMSLATTAGARPDRSPGDEAQGLLNANAVAQVGSEQRPLGLPQESQPLGRAEQPRSSGENWVTQTVLALGGVLALALLGALVARSVARGQGGLRASLGAGGRSPAGILEVIGRYPIARGCTLVLLKLDRRILLLSQSAQGKLGTGAAFTTLCEIDDPEEVASILMRARDEEGESMSQQFSGLLSRFDRDLELSGEMAGEENPAGRRQIRAGRDRAEFWHDGRGEIPVVDLTQERLPGQSSGPIASLRQRLASLRGEGGSA